MPNTDFRRRRPGTRLRRTLLLANQPPNLLKIASFRGSLFAPLRVNSPRRFNPRKRRPTVLLTPPSVYIRCQLQRRRHPMFTSPKEGGPAANLPPTLPHFEASLPVLLREHLHRLKLLQNVLSVAVMALHR